MASEDSIADLHRRIHRQIGAIDMTETRQRLELKADFERLFDLVKLFLIAERDVYYGYFLMAMRIEVDFESDLVAGVKLNEYPPVFKTNPLLLGAFTLKELLYIVCHEIDHVVFNHPAEMVRLNPGGDPARYELFNLAADASINDLLNAEADSGKTYLSMPKGAVTSKSLEKRFGLKGVLPLQSYRYYFDLLLEALDENELAALGFSHSEQGSRSPLERAALATSGGDDANCEGTTDEEDVGVAGASRPVGELKGRGVPAVDHDWGLEDEEYEAALAEGREFLNAVNSLMSVEARGCMPGHYSEQVKRLNEPPAIPWQVTLKRYIGTVESGYRKTRSRLNRRQPKRYDLSGVMRDKDLNIVVVIDVSGSVSREQLAAFFREVFAILARSAQPITIIECDMKVQRVYKAKWTDEVHFDVCGRGGTAFSPAVEYINSHREYRDALVVFFTDGFGESKIPKPRTYRNLWVVLGSTDNLSVENPYGSVVALEANCG